MYLLRYWRRGEERRGEKYPRARRQGSTRLLFIPSPSPPPPPSHPSPLTAMTTAHCPLSRLPMSHHNPLVWWGSLKEANICWTKSRGSLCDVTSPVWPRPSPAPHTADSFIEKITENFKQIGNYRELSRESVWNDENIPSNMSHRKTVNSWH